MTPDSIIQVAKLTHHYGDFRALDGLDLQVPEGSFFGLLGPNGAGKSTILNILTAQMPPTSGKVHVLGMDVIARPLDVKRRIGIVPENESPPSFLTCEETLHFVAESYGLNNPEKEAAKWLSFFGLEEKKDSLGKDLSQGMKQKLLLASALIPRTRLLFLDEPFINLDPIFQRKLKNYLVNFVAKGGTIFMCTHLLEIAEKVCTHVAIISEGKILEKGTLEAIRIRGLNLEKLFFESVGASQEPRESSDGGRE